MNDEQDNIVKPNLDTQQLMIDAIDAALMTDNSPGVLRMKQHLEAHKDYIRSLENLVHNLKIDNFRLAKELEKKKRRK